MAIVKVTFTIRDAKEQTGKVSFYSDTEYINGPDVENLQGFIQEAAHSLDLMIKGVIIKQTVSFDVPLKDFPGVYPALKGVPDVDSDIEEKALFLFPTATGNVFKQAIPTFRHELFGSGVMMSPNQLPTNNDPVYLGHWEEYMTFAIELPPEWVVAVTDSRGEDLHPVGTRIQKIFRPR